jgi:hypothetical protein
MEKFVIKRNGEYKLLEEFKIKHAIEKGFLSVGKEYNDVIFCRLFSSFLCVPYIYKNINDL